MIFLLSVVVRVVALLLNSIVETFAPHSQKKKTVLRSSTSLYIIQFLYSSVF